VGSQVIRPPAGMLAVNRAGTQTTSRRCWGRHAATVRIGVKPVTTSSYDFVRASALLANRPQLSL